MVQVNLLSGLEINFKRKKLHARLLTRNVSGEHVLVEYDEILDELVDGTGLVGRYQNSEMSGTAIGGA